MSAFGRWFSGRRSEQPAPAAPEPPATAPDGEGPSDAAVPPDGVDWGSRGEVELGPPPPPDADVNQGPPTGPLPVLGASPWGAPRRAVATPSAADPAPTGPTSADPIPAGPIPTGPIPAGPIPADGSTDGPGAVPGWARSERTGDGSAEPPWRRPTAPDAGPSDGAPDAARASVDAFTAWFATSAAGVADGTATAPRPDSWPPADADSPAQDSGADGPDRDGTSPLDASPEPGSPEPGTGPDAAPAGPTSLSEEVADAGTDADPADPESRAGAARSGTDVPTDASAARPADRTSASPWAERGTGTDMSSPVGNDEPTPPAGLPVAEVPVAEVTADPEATAGTGITTGTETSDDPEVTTGTETSTGPDVPVAEVPPAVVADDRADAAAGPPEADELDAPVHADVHSPIALDPDLRSATAPEQGPTTGDRGADAPSSDDEDTAGTTSSLTASSFALRPESTTPDRESSNSRGSSNSTDTAPADDPATVTAETPTAQSRTLESRTPGSRTPGSRTPGSRTPGTGTAATPAAATPAPASGGRTVGAASAPDVVVDRGRLAQGRLGIDAVTPEVSGGRFPSKAVVGEVVPVTATVWREGHDGVGASVVWSRCSDTEHAAATADLRGSVCGASGGETREVRMVSAGPETDRFVGTIVPDAEGLWSFRVDAWSDPWATWRHTVEVKEAAGQGPAELANDLEAGARLLDRAAAAIRERFRTGASTPSAPSAPRTDAPGTDTAGISTGATAPIAMPPALAIAQTLGLAAQALRDDSAGLAGRLGPALAPAVDRTMIEQPVRELVTRGATHHVVVERARALDGAWYEFFPRSTGGTDAAGRPVHGTFATATRELERVAAMGFDVAYLPPIHPVGRVNRKGPNNALVADVDDVGSPWAIGSADGGHDAIDPALGTVEDFDAFVARAHELGLEVALDFALQCAPDHPWAAEHPEWFTVRPDGTIAYAENPPKKYQDIYPVNFDVDPEGIYRESLRVLLGWLEHGVRIFRVDNPHTKPPDFWAWVIAEVHRVDPGVVFLAEAFTRPARMFGLADLGFSQSYTYFTWRTGKEELQEFFELHRDRIDECRPNCFVNTPDILHASLQAGGPGMFALRAALAATLSPSWGVYAGFELFEDRAVRPGSEEYLDSEKYQLRPRDSAGALAAGRSLEPWIARLNEIRRAHPALRQIRTLRFHEVDNPALLAFSKTDPRTGDAVVGVITLNPFGAEEGTLRLDLPALGLGPSDRFAAVDEVSGETFDWGPANFVRLEPWHAVAHVISVRRR